MVSFVVPGSASAQADRVRISNLNDVSFGSIVNLQVDSRRSQSICLAANTPNGLYSVTASGTGPGGALELSNGFSKLPFSVEWSPSPGQSIGANLVANTALVGQFSDEKQQDCKPRGLETASLVIILRGSELSRAFQGDYSGVLSILIAAQ